jgi:sulfur carrier protein
MSVAVNGLPHDLDDGTTVAELVALLGAPRTGVAVAIDRDVVPRSAWEETVISDGARVEVLNAVQGG